MPARPGNLVLHRFLLFTFLLFTLSWRHATLDFFEKPPYSIFMNEGDGQWTFFSNLRPDGVKEPAVLPRRGGIFLSPLFHRFGALSGGVSTPRPSTKRRWNG